VSDDIVRCRNRYYLRLDGQHRSGAVYKVAGWPQVACRLVGEMVEVADDGDGGEVYDPSGLFGVVMVGDDFVHLVEPDRLVPVEREEYCGECGQLGCAHDGLDRGDDDDAAEADICADEVRRTGGKW
jgi:hypothetical protein